MTRPDMYDLIRQDLASRERLGIERYGKKLEPFCGKDMLVETFEEILDAAVYIRTLIYERDGK